MTSVVLLHGLWMNGVAMAVLRRRLVSRGFRVASFNYGSVTGSLEANAAALAAFLDGVPGETIHLVAHSLGGVVIRVMLDGRVPERLGRAVLLGSPLRGSQIAARVAQLPGGRLLIGKGIAELNARGGFDRWRHELEAGCIAGRQPFGLGRYLGRFTEPNDGTVAVAETRVDGMRDHLVLPVTHLSLLWSEAVSSQVEHFLGHGRFTR